MGAGADEPLEDGRSHEGRDNGHDDQHGEKPFRDDAALEPDVDDDDEFHQSGQTLPVIYPAFARSRKTMLDGLPTAE